jgi:hypothetical protein
MPHFDPQAAISTETGNILFQEGLTGSVYETQADAEAQANPLTVTAAGGVPTTTLSVSPIGQLPGFDHDEFHDVWWSPGDGITVRLISWEAVMAGHAASVKSVNGVTPDEDGDVELTIEGGGADDDEIGELITAPESATYAALTERFGVGFAVLDLDDSSAGLPEGTIILRTAGGGTPPPVPVVYFEDDFERTVAAGSIGDPSGGGSYSLIDIAADWSVGSGAAIWKAPAAGARGGYIRSSSYSQETVEMVGVISQESGAVGNRVVTVAPRRPLGTNVQYGANITLRGPSASRPLQVDLALQKGTTEGDLQSATGGVVTTGALGDKVWFRVRTSQVDASTTRVQARIWLDGTEEPTTWQKDATDSTVDLQGAGSMAILVRQNNSESVGSEVRIHEITVLSVIDA